MAYADVQRQLNREISHVNVVALKEVILEEKSIYMVFEYAEHDFLVRHLPSGPRQPLIQCSTSKSYTITPKRSGSRSNLRP